MPSIEQYDWSKLKPKQPESRIIHGTKQFATYKYIEPHKYSKNGAIKITRSPKAIDKSIGDFHDNALRVKFKNL